jgi:flagellar basal-body rod protein FlgG
MSGFIDTYTALDARMKTVDVIANNLANANTAGFKRDFGLILQTEIGSQAATQVDLSPGAIVSTGNELDAALNGDGFFVIQTPDGQRYTRSGSFAVNAAGELVTKEGMKVLSSTDSPVSVGEGQVAIADGGAVLVNGSEIARLKVVTMNDPSKIRKEGLSKFSWGGDPNGIQTLSDPPVKGGYLEKANVNSVDEMVHLMSAYREFESVQRALKTLMTDMDGRLVQELGKLG